MMPMARLFRYFYIHSADGDVNGLYWACIACEWRHWVDLGMDDTSNDIQAMVEHLLDPACAQFEENVKILDEYPTAIDFLGQRARELYNASLISDNVNIGEADSVETEGLPPNP